MKGVVFTEFLELIENAFGPDVLETVIENANPESGAAYTAVGTYDHTELLAMVTELSDVTNTPVPALVETFGKHLFSQFVEKYPVFFEGVSSSFEFLSQLEAYIHFEVAKLYPDAELPTFSYEQPADDVLVMTYKSTRPFADLALGLMKACVEYFNEEISIDREDLNATDGIAVKFTLTKAPVPQCAS